MPLALPPPRLERRPREDGPGLHPRRTLAALLPGLAVLAVLAWGASLPLLAAAPPPGVETLSPADLRLLAAGRTIARLEDRPAGEGSEGPREGLAMGVLPHPPERVFRAITDLEHYDEFMPFMESSRVLRRGRGASSPLEASIHLDLPFPASDRRYRVRLDSGTREASPRGPALRWASWRLVPGSGNVTENRGSWALLPDPEGSPGRTLVVLRMVSDVGPSMADRLQDRATLETLPWVLDGLAQHVNRCRYDRPVPEGCADPP